MLTCQPTSSPSHRQILYTLLWGHILTTMLHQSHDPAIAVPAKRPWQLRGGPLFKKTQLCNKHLWDSNWPCPHAFIGI